jgi:hypothetical protein
VLRKVEFYGFRAAGENMGCHFFTPLTMLQHQKVEICSIEIVAQSAYSSALLWNATGAAAGSSLRPAEYDLCMSGSLCRGL